MNRLKHISLIILSSLIVPTASAFYSDDPGASVLGGAATGGLIGGLAGGRRGAAIGLGVGALAGGMGREGKKEEK